MGAAQCWQSTCKEKGSVMHCQESTPPPRMERSEGVRAEEAGIRTHNRRKAHEKRQWTKRVGRDMPADKASGPVLTCLQAAMSFWEEDGVGRSSKPQHSSSPQGQRLPVQSGPLEGPLPDASSLNQRQEITL